jgi:adsorption protein B
MFELYLDTLQVSVWCMAIVFLISGLDELLFDSAFVAWKIYYRFVLLRGRQRLRLSTLQAKEEQPVAIMIPAWKESAIIAGTVRNAIREIDYESYVIFVGVYPNDTETHDAVLSVIKEFPSRIRIALVSHDGPTTKSDCLNAIVSASKVWEKEINKQVEIYVLHDAEDLW